MDSVWLAVVVAALGSSGLWTVINGILSARREKKSRVLIELERMNRKIDALEQKIDSVDQKGDQRNAVSTRVRILRFNDELQEERRHSKDSFDQVLSDISEYNRYCDEHPAFKNNQTEATVRYICRVYDERLEKHDFGGNNG